MDKDSSGAIAIFGGSFSPPHTGHVLAAHYALLRWNLKKVLIIPSFQHPFGKTLPSFQHRLAMCEIAFSHLGSYVKVSDVERERGGISYTIDTVRYLKEKFTGDRLRLLVGGDILGDVGKWREFDELKRLAPLLVIPRISDGKVQGGTDFEAALPDVNSRSIREHIAAGRQPDGALPLEVLKYIQAHSLYTNTN